MTKNFGSEGLDIFREDIVASFDQSEDTSGTNEGESSASRCSIREEGSGIHFLFLESSKEMGFLG